MLVCRDCGRPRESNERVCPDCGADGWIADNLRVRLAPKRASGRVGRQRRKTRRVFDCRVSNDQVAEALDYFDQTDWRDVRRDVVELHWAAQPSRPFRAAGLWFIAAVMVGVPLGRIWVDIRHGGEPRSADWAMPAVGALLLLIAGILALGDRRIAARFAKVEFASSLQELCERFYPVALFVPHPDRTGGPKASAVFAPVLALVAPPVWAAYGSTPASAGGKEEGPDRDSGNSRCPHCGHRIASPEERPLVCGWCGRGLRSLVDVHRLWWSVRSTLGLSEMELANARASRRPGASPRIVDLEVDLTLTPLDRATFRTTAIKAEGHWFMVSPEPGDEVTETETAADAEIACGR